MRSLVLAVIVSAALAASSTAAPFLRVSAVQMRPVPKIEDNAKKICGFLDTLAADNVKIAVFPEIVLTPSPTSPEVTSETVEAALATIGASCKKNKIYAIVGAAEPRPEGKLWNSAIVFDPEGKIIERYHKVHLAEGWSEPGDHLALFDIAGTKGTIIICHDERYPEFVRLPVMAGARLVFYISWESGVRDEQKIDPYRAQIQARAVENSVWVIHANAPANDDLSGSHGQSRIINPGGTIMKEATMFGEEVVTWDIDRSMGKGGLAVRSMEDTKNIPALKEFWRVGLKVFEKSE